jgi:NADPH:quinone reductase-like Zn-dependent oxidoreductase
MKAIIYTEYGPPEVLRLAEVEKPAPKDDEVLIKVRAAEATKADCEMRSFKFPVKWFWLPLRLALGVMGPKRRILGGYFAGEVAAVGKGVSKFKKGDRIFGTARLRLGAYGEYLCLPAAFTLAPMPANVGFEEAAAVPLGGLNAIHFMRRAGIKKGEKVLIIGAGGSIGVYALQIAKALGAEVTAVDSGIKKEMLLGLGADHFIDHTRGESLGGGHRYDVIFNMVAGASYARCVGALNPKGRYLIGNPRLADMLRSILTPVFSDKEVIFAFAGETEEELLELKKMIEEGAIKPVVDLTYALEQAADAHRWVEAEQRQGPVVLVIGGE